MSSCLEKVFHFNNELTEEQVCFFKTHGVIQFKKFVSADTLQAYISEVENVQAELLRKNITMINGIPLRFGYSSTGEKIIQRIAFASLHSEILSSFLKEKRLQIISELLGSGRIGEHEKDGMIINHYENTATSTLKNMGWHTDTPRDIFLGRKIMPMLNIGLHLDDCPFENGGLRVLPGTHKQNLFKLLFRKKYFVDNKPDPAEVGFNIEGGDLTIHDGNLWHRVQRSPFVGEKSRRRVIYIPVITGRYEPKHPGSPTPFYHKLFGKNFKDF